MLRISAGMLKGVTLAVPPKLRPTETKVRQAIFNILGSFIEGARVIDAFAGSGSLGLEALSRGAAFVAFIESNTEAIMSIRDNLERVTEEIPRDAWRLLHLDVEHGVRELATDQAPFDVVLLDPPYRGEEGRKALNALGECAIVAPDGIVAIEHHRRTILPSVIGPLHQHKQHRYGDTVLSFYRPAS